MKRLKRSWIRPKKRVRKVLWRTGQIKEDAAGMHALRRKVYARSEGRCENVVDGKRCGVWVAWAGPNKGELHHTTSRGHGGSDDEINCKFFCRPCHRGEHPGPQWSSQRGRPLPAGPDTEGFQAEVSADD